MKIIAITFVATKWKTPYYGEWIFWLKKINKLTINKYIILANKIKYFKCKNSNFQFYY